MSATFHLQTFSNKIFYQPDTRVTPSSLRTSAAPSRSVHDLMQRCRSLKRRLWWSQFSYAHPFTRQKRVTPESFIQNRFLLKFRKWHPPAMSSSIKDSPARLGTIPDVVKLKICRYPPLQEMVTIGTVGFLADHTRHSHTENKWMDKIDWLYTFTLTRASDIQLGSWGFMANLNVLYFLVTSMARPKSSKITMKH